MKVVYISIPMTGHVEEVQRQYANKVEKELKSKGFKVINPFDISSELDCDYTEHLGYMPKYRDYLLNDYIAIVGCDAMYMCDGWKESKGCTAEYYFAKAIGLEIMNI